MSEDSADGSTEVLDALEGLREEVSAVEGVTAEIHDDDSAMTPMLAVTFDRFAERTAVFRALFEAEGPVAVDSVHADRVVVRGE